MKTLIRPFIYIMSALMVLSFASCNDFLDKEPEGKVPEEKVDYTNTAICTNRYQAVYAKHSRQRFGTGVSGKLLRFATRTYLAASGMAATITT